MEGRRERGGEGERMKRKKRERERWIKRLREQGIAYLGRARSRFLRLAVQESIDLSHTRKRI